MRFDSRQIVSGKTGAIQGGERYTTQIIADSMQMLGEKPSDSGQNDKSQTSDHAGSDSNSGFNDMDDDIPF